MSEERHVRELQALNAEVRVCEREGMHVYVNVYEYVYVHMYMYIYICI